MSLNKNNLIAAENIPMWVASGFIIALLALMLSLTNVYRTNVTAVAAQAQLLALNQKVEDLKKASEAPATAAPAAAVVPAATQQAAK